MTYHSNALRQPTVRPSDSPPAVGVQADPLAGQSLIGIAFPVSHVGGMDHRNPLADYRPSEVVWRLQIDRAWIDGKIIILESKEFLDGRFVLRSGVFVELAEDVA